MRRSSTFARQVLLVRVGRRDGAAVSGTDLVTPDHRYADRQRLRYGRLDTDIEVVRPISPALAPA
ncbi:CDP-alcohol phosphatidyltransferase, partial [Micromonospora sp. CPCC 205714]